ncbi:unnamed protein product [Rotaria magnacalcarata]|uniref:PLAT domain-containing protein n=3 Tax=Rotaria magnacalcarata TaxID=392030 RepID=A0A816FUW5_9BILA|nr:unnamed protein product [Rotaria magnacalcarata]CAF1665943.1 unnamed protein product [Rotaria magnacalcarata]CAF2048285.1 unnamed protein product [Rotaria magnacalcarata]
MSRIFIFFTLILPYSLAEVWIIHVHTANEQYAGTDANVYIRLFNPKHESTGEYQLTHSNWQPEPHELPFRNLFEIGAVERFRIRTEDIGAVAKIEIRHNNFPSLHADWLLNQVIVERARDKKEYVFKCNCWLKRERPYATINVLPDPNVPTKPNDNASSNLRTLVIVVVVLIAVVIAVICCSNEYYRRKHHASMRSTYPNESIYQEPSLLDAPYVQTPEVQSESLQSNLWVKTLRRWKDFRQRPPSYIHAQGAQLASTPTMPSLVVPDEPPSYEDLYPNSTLPATTTTSNSIIRYI